MLLARWGRERLEKSLVVDGGGLLVLLWAAPGQPPSGQVVNCTGMDRSELPRSFYKSLKKHQVRLAVGLANVLFVQLQLQDPGAQESQWKKSNKVGSELGRV